MLGIAVGAVDLPIGSVVAELLDKVPGVDIESGLSEREAQSSGSWGVPRSSSPGWWGDAGHGRRRLPGCFATLSPTLISWE